MRAERSSTIGTERLTNYALQIASRQEFVRELTSKMPVRPEYFLQDAQINREGAAALSQLADLAPVSPVDLKALLDDGVIALDVRPGDEFATGHVPGSINIPLSGQFASWAGSVLGLSSRPVLIADSEEQRSEARLRLARVGIEDARGYLQGGVAAWKQAGLPIADLPQIPVEALKTRMRAGDLHLLDVRREGEWKAGHISGANWQPLDTLSGSLPQIDPNAPIAVHCKSGYRSGIACSILQRTGFRNVSNVIGGFDAWQAANLPIVNEQTVEA
jgi:rhodanese-related sulfurtransferase